MKKQDKNLAHFFKNIIMMSGTPDSVQQEMSKKNRANECKCSPKLAMDNGWICKPSLNLVNCSESAWPNAVKAVFEREMKIWQENGHLFKPTILVNCKSIDAVACLREMPWFKNNAGKLFHLISIHSKKTVHDSLGFTQDLAAEIDGRSVEADEAYEAVASIDSQEDSLPIIVFQVQMIGEGINVRSFNAVITASNSDKTAMQQIGRVLRDFTVKKTVVEKHEEKLDGFFNRLFKKTRVVETQVEKTFTKVKDGTSNVYVINDNLKTLTDLIVNLSNYDLTSSCFSWGDKIDINDGGAPEVLDEADSAKLLTPEWTSLDEKNPQIIEVLNTAKKKIRDIATYSFLFNAEDNDGNGIPDVEELDALLDEERASGYVEAWTGRKNAKAETAIDKFNRIMSKMMLDPTFKSLWAKSRKAAIGLIVQNPKMVEFFDTHMNEKMLDSFGG